MADLALIPSTGVRGARLAWSYPAGIEGSYTGMTRQKRMESALKTAFDPVRLAVIDESHMHAGHQPGFDGSGETHFRIRLESACFTKLGRVARHRAVNDALLKEFEGGLHALAIEAAAPGEATRW